MKIFFFGDYKIKFRFVISDDQRIYFYDESSYPLTNNQKYYLENFTNPVEISISGHATSEHTGDRHIFTSESQTLKYVKHSIKKDENGKTLIIKQKNDSIEVLTYYILYNNTHTIRSYNVIKNISKKPITLEYVSSFVKKDMIGYYHYQDSKLAIPHNSWYLECQWKYSSLLDLGIVSCNELKNFKKYCVNNTGCWSSKNYIPMGILKDPHIKKCIMWQIEANGSWSYEIGDFIGNVTLNLSGPSLQENGWQKTLLPKEVFTSVKASITYGKDENECIKHMTFYRRKIATRLFDIKENPIIFNEYMFASWNCPSFKTASSLGKVAKKVGANYFVIDCGWHDEIENPFYYVGKWNESKLKYPEGLNKTLDYLRSLGLKVGLWMEPEVVGALLEDTSFLDEDCFFHRNNERLIISNRYQLDFRNKKVQDYFLNKVDEIMGKYHVDYFKFDYNIEPGIGLDSEDGYGEALLEHNRAYFDCITKIGLKYPSLIIESCASGGNRLDYLTLSNVNLVSTSDQTNYLIYPYITANILSAVLPEQAAVWCYPKDESFSDEEIDDEAVNLNLINSMIGRVHLASKLYLLSEEKQNRIKEGLSFYHELDELKQNGYLFLPNGFTSYYDSQLAYGIRNEKYGYLFVYQMKGTKPLKVKIGKYKKIELAYPLDLPTDYEMKGKTLVFTPHRDKIARLFKIIYE